MTCKKAQGFLERQSIPIKTVVDANKDTQGRAQALALARAAAKVIVAKGKKVVAFDMKKEAPDDDTLAVHLLGPTGNLRAPTVRVGPTLFVGFNDDAYQALL